MSDRHAIEEVLIRYCRAIDERDAEGMRALLTDDYSHTSPETEHNREVVNLTTPDELVEGLRRAPLGRGAIQHFQSNVVVDVDGDHAHATTYMWSPIRPWDGTDATIFGGFSASYHLRRDGGSWRISRSEVTPTWEVDPRHAGVGASGVAP